MFAAFIYLYDTQSKPEARCNNLLLTLDILRITTTLLLITSAYYVFYAVSY